MTKKTKLVLIICSVVLVLLLILYYCCSLVYKPKAIPLAYPQGSLSDSLFVSQNNVYTKNESLPQTFSCPTAPFLIDVPSGLGATVGTGSIFKVSDTVFVYIVEYTDSDAIQNIIAQQFPEAVLMDYDKTKSSINNVVDNHGFINGFNAEYLVDQLNITNNSKRVLTCIMGYALDLGDKYSGKNLFVAVGTTDQSSQNFAACQKVLDMIMGTVRYDETLDKKQQEAKADEAAKAAAAETSTAETAETADAGTDATLPANLQDSGSSDTVSNGQDNPNVTELPVTVPDDYKQLIVTATWTQANSGAVCELFFPDGSQYCDPTETTDTTAKFVLNDAAAGTYSLHIKNYLNCGQISMSVDGTRADGQSANTPTGTPLPDSNAETAATNDVNGPVVIQ
jgi:hypothetical protein